MPILNYTKLCPHFSLFHIGKRGKYDNAKCGQYHPLNPEKYTGKYPLIYKSDLERGQIIRCAHLDEGAIDLLIADSYDRNSGYSLWEISGYKAGLKYVRLPKESMPATNEGYAIDTTWLIKNWEKWGYIDGCI